MSSQLFRKKDFQSITSEVGDEGLETSGSGLKKILSVRDLALMGIAAVVGAGIFSTVGNAAEKAGPGVAILFVLAAITCAFSALCYAEFSSYIPLSGSAYTYTYFSFGEILAWVVGWALILEYGISNSALAISWSSYFQNLLEGLNIYMPTWLVNNYEKSGPKIFANAPRLFGLPIIFNLPAFGINILITALAYLGIKESKKVTNITVIFKIALLIFLIILGFFYVKPENWNPFLPNGMAGVLSGVPAVFFAFIGFDALSTTAEECRNPKRDLPRSMIIALVACTILYIGIALVLTGMIPYHKLGVEDPIASAFQYVNLDFISYFISASALVVIFSAFIVFQLAQPRIWMSMGRDGLLPNRFSYIHPKYKTPTFSTIITGVIVGIPAAFLDLSIVTDLTSVGTLFAFIIVCGGVISLSEKRKKDPNMVKPKYCVPFINARWIIPFLGLGILWVLSDDLERACKHFSWESIPLFCFVLGTIGMSVFSFIKSLSLIPVLGFLSCFYLITQLGWKNWMLFFVWIVIGLIIYALFSYRNSKLHVASKK